MHIVYQAHRGRCAYCGYPLSSRNRRASNALFFSFYVPLDRGGSVELDNILPTCKLHINGGQPLRGIRERIPDINTIADLIDVMVKTRLELPESEHPHLLLYKLDKVKKMLNILFEDVVTNMRYRPPKDWVPEQYTIIMEDDNTIPDEIDNLVKAEDEPTKEEAKKQIAERVKQIAVTGKYKIIRNMHDDD